MDPNFYDLVVMVAGAPANDLESLVYKILSVVLGVLFIWSIFYLVKTVGDAL